MKHTRQASSKPKANKTTRSRSCRNNTRTATRQLVHNTKSRHKPIFCNGCKKTFTNFKNTREFINEHSMLHDVCKKSLYECHLCCTSYYKEDDRSRHFSHSKKCLNFFCQKEQPKKYCTSEVQIANVVDSKTCVPINSLCFNNSQLRYNHVNPKDTFNSVNKYLVASDSKTLAGHIKTKHHTPSRKYNKSLVSSSTNNLSSTCNTNSTISVSSYQNPEIQDTTSSVSQEHNRNRNEDSRLVSFLNHSQPTVDFNESNSSQTNIAFELDDDTIANDINDLHNDYNYDIQQVQDIPTQQLTIIDVNHLLCLKNVHLHELSTKVSDTDYKDALELVQILMKKKLSLSSYDEFMKWKHSSCNNKSYYSLSALKKTALNRVYGKTLGNKMYPKNTILECPSTGRKVNVVTTDIDAIIVDMLSDKELTCHDNLIFKDGDIDDPFHWNLNENYGDFEQSGFYNNTVKEYITNRDTELLVPICIYMDETTLDAFGKLSLHPVVMTLMIYNRKTRNLEMTWRTIGYLPNFNEMKGTKNLTPEQKLNDFHYILRYILNGIEKLQSIKEGLDWEFEFPEFPNKKYIRKLKFPISHIIGDAKGNDTLCGRFQSRVTTKYLCRDCDVLTQESDDTQSKCNFFQYDILQAKTKDEMEELCFRKIEPYNAFESIWFGSNPYGLNGACPPDPLHQINKGIPQRLPNCFLKERLSINLVKQFDNHVSYICTHYRRQSDRDVPELRFFCKGVSEDSKLSGNENIGRLFAMYLTLLTRDFERICVGQKGRKPDKETPATIISQTEYNNWILVFEETLILVAWVYYEKHPKVVFKGGRNSVSVDRMRDFMNTFKETAKRSGGMGFKLLKYHQLLHLWIVIRMYSSLTNVDSARNESHHKKKKVSHRILKRDYCYWIIKQQNTNLIIIC